MLDLMSAEIAKALSERERLERLLVRQEGSVQRAFAAFLADARSDESIREVRLLLQRGRLEQALGIVDEHVVTMGNVIPRVFTDSASGEAEAVRSGIERLTGRARVAISFDPSNERAAELMRRNRLSFIREFSRQQRDAVRSSVVTGLREGAGAREMGEAFRDSIGLTRAQLDAVNNYRDLLQRRSPEALLRTLRDRRFDPTVGRVATDDEADPLSSTQIERMVERYRSRYLDYRAETIARTEALSIMHQARHEAWRQLQEQSGIDPGSMRRTWRAVLDKRTRDTHREMDGQQRGMDDKFESPSGAQLMYPGDRSAPAEEVINCRCTLTLDFEGEG